MMNSHCMRLEAGQGKERPLRPNRITVFFLLLCTLASGGFAQQGPRGNLYTVPNSTFFQQPSGESVITINDTSGSIATLQVIINNTRITNPGKLILINLLPGAPYTVNGAPLQLESEMCLAGTGATIVAASPSIAATCLIR